jgi:dephospho-CoA kinase
MLKIGITGGIGSGKTTVAQIFELLNVPVYYSDARGKWLLDHYEPLKNAVKELFGTTVYDPETDLLKRHELAKLVFAKPLLLKQLDAIVHPTVAQDAALWNEKMLQQGIPYTLQESALIYEAKLYLRLDKVITVFAPQEIRIQRVMNRNKWTREEVLQRITQQIPDEEKKAKADFVIINDGEISLIQQCLNIHQKILALV